MNVTDGDLEKAAILAKSAADGVHAWVTEGQGGYVYSAAIDEIAAALAEEREKARAPFLALADEYDANINWREWGIGNRIRRAAEEIE